MNKKIPHSPFTTRLSGSAKEMELRIRNIFQWKKKRPPVVLFVLTATLVLLCCSLVSCQEEKKPSSDENSLVGNDSQQISPLEGDALSPDGKYEVRLNGSAEGVSTSSDGLTPPESVQIVDVQSNEVLWECDGLYRHAVLWSPDSAYLALARTARTYCTVTIIETKSWTNWDVTLPDGSTIPEYTFLPDEGWGEWLVEHNFLLTIGRDSKDGQNTYRCVPVPQDGGLSGITEPLTAEVPVNDPSVVLTAMAAVKAADFTNPEYFGIVTAEALAAALNAAVDKQISEAEFMDALGGSYAGVFPHWYIEDAWLEGGSGGHPGTDRNLDIRCGLPENIVEVTLSEDNHRNTAYFEDKALYWLVREKDAVDERMTAIDPAAYEKFKDLLVSEMEFTLALFSDNPGNFTGYELTRFRIAWSYEDERDGSRVELYHFGFGLLTDTPETVGWAGGMALDHKLRVVGVGPGQLAVKYRNGQVVCTTFMGNDFYYSPDDISQADWAKEHINSALDQAESSPVNQFDHVWNGETVEFMELSILLPDNWKGKVSYERGHEWIAFYHLASRQVEGWQSAGNLFTVSWSLGPLPLDYLFPTPGEVLATTADASYILTMPSDGQSAAETVVEYMSLNIADVQFVPSQELLQNSVNRFN